LNNTIAQFKLKRASSSAKDTRIKSLEGLIIELGHEPKDIKATKKLIKKRNEDIAALKDRSNCLSHNTLKQNKSYRAKIPRRKCLT